VFRRTDRNTAVVEGTCLDRGNPCTFRLRVSERPAGHGRDTIEFTEAGAAAYSASGEITSGKIKVGPA
jgi:hypothetical protein